MDLMQRCMFLAPLSNFQHSLSSDESSSTPVKQVCNIMCSKVPATQIHMAAENFDFEGIYPLDHSMQ